MRRLALATFTLAAASAFAQASVGPDNGFFRPTPNNDPSLTNYLVPVPPAQPQPQPALQPLPQPQPAVVVPVPVPAQAVAPAQVAEEQVDRAIREADEARARAAQAPAPIVGAFTGQTNERDR